MSKCENNKNYYFDNGGHICVKNYFAFWLPELTFEKEVSGTTYSVSGDYAGSETLNRKLERIAENNFENMEET